MRSTPAPSETNRPNFFIVGAPKCGTSALYDYLSQHPDIYMSEIKEPDYFRGESSFTTERDYLALFAGATGESRIGEASPGYLRSDAATGALHAFDPNARILIMLREPVSLVYSAYWQRRLNGRESARTFVEALETPSVGTGVCTPVPYRELPLLSQHIERYFQRFGRKNVHVALLDDIVVDASGAYARILRFLGVDDRFVADFKVINARRRARSDRVNKLFNTSGLNVRELKRTPLFHRIGGMVPPSVRQHALGLARRVLFTRASIPPLDPDLRLSLALEFRPEVARLSRLLERDLGEWTSS